MLFHFKGPKKFRSQTFCDKIIYDNCLLYINSFKLISFGFHRTFPNNFQLSSEIYHKTQCLTSIRLFRLLNLISYVVVIATFHSHQIKEFSLCSSQKFCHELKLSNWNFKSVNRSKHYVQILLLEAFYSVQEAFFLLLHLVKCELSDHDLR